MRIDSDNGYAPFVKPLGLHRNTNVLILLRTDGSEVGRLVRPMNLAAIETWLTELGPRIARMPDGDSPPLAIRARAEIFVSGVDGVLEVRAVASEVSDQTVEALAAAWGLPTVAPRKPTPKSSAPPKPRGYLQVLDAPHVRLVAPGGLSVSTQLGAVTAIEIVVALPRDDQSKSGLPPKGYAVTEKGVTQELAPLDPARTRALTESLRAVSLRAIRSTSGTDL